MGKMNLLKGKWDGKVGETVGSKWKDKSTIRTYSKPSNPNTPDQQSVRNAFKDMSQFVALFADQIKYKSALNTSGMSVRNAIIKLNKDQIDARAFNADTLLISKGGLQKPISFAAELNTTTSKVDATWSKPTATNFSNEAKLVVVAVSEEKQMVDVFEADADAETASGTVAFTGATDVKCYAYYLDMRGSNKVASISVQENA